MEEEITKFYHKLTFAVLIIKVGSQNGFADVNLGLHRFPNAFIEHFALGRIFTLVAQQYHPESTELIAHRLINDDEHKHFIISGQKPDIYPYLKR